MDAVDRASDSEFGILSIYDCDASTEPSTCFTIAPISRDPRSRSLLRLSH
jgi:hypothetical protein